MKQTLITLFCCFFLFACVPDNLKNSDEIGRFQIVENSSVTQLQLLDTVTGKTWMWTTFSKDNEMVGVWIPTVRFSTRQKLSDYSDHVWAEVK